MAASAQPRDQYFDFGDRGCDACSWFVVVDGVMGGRSTAEISTTDKTLVMQGTISLENNGGFASLRTPFDRFDLSEFEEVEIRYRLTGQSFAFILANNRRFFEPRFKAVLPETNNEWQTVTLPFSQFKKMRFDTVLGGGPDSSELKRIIRLGLISNDKRASEFRLELDYVRFQATSTNTES